jgi:hypothetical protein
MIRHYREFMEPAPFQRSSFRTIRGQGLASFSCSKPIMHLESGS